MMEEPSGDEVAVDLVCFSGGSAAEEESDGGGGQRMGGVLRQRR